MNQVFDRTAREPIDRIAAIQSHKGSRHSVVSKINPDVVRSSVPLPTQFYYGTENLIGFEFGNLTVIGVALKQNPNKKRNWVVKCKCGMYEHRKATVLKRGIGDYTKMCSACAIRNAEVLSYNNHAKKIK